MLGTYYENMVQYDHSKVHIKEIMIFERNISYKS
jgi:hypothetical protein